MSILKEIEAPNRLLVRYHRVARVESSGSFESAVITVHSYDSEHTFLIGGMVQWSWSISTVTQNVGSLSLRALEVCLTTLYESPFLGGAVLEDAGEDQVRKIVLWERMKQARNQAEISGFAFDGSTFDSDTISQQRIQGAAQLATLAMINNQPFSIDWTLADNSVRTLNAQEMIAVGRAMGEHINACHVKARQLRAMIDAATTKEEVEAISWSSIGD